MTVLYPAGLSVVRAGPGQLAALRRALWCSTEPKIIGKYGSLIWSTLPYRSLIRGAPHFLGPYYAFGGLRFVQAC